MTFAERRTLKKITLFFATCVFLLMPSCAKQSPMHAGAPLLPKDKKASALVEQIKNFSENTQVIKALATLEISDGNEERRTEAAVVVSRPDKIRIDAIDAVADVWAEVGNNKDGVWLYLPAKKKLYSGSQLKKRIDKYFQTEFNVVNVIALLTGVPPLEGLGEFYEVGKAKDNHFAADKLHVWLARPRGNIVKCVRYKNGGSEIAYSVSFQDYRRVGKVFFPFRVEVIFPDKGARALVEYSDVVIQDNVDEKVFWSSRGKEGDVNSERE